jgi:hypothetical protein
MGEAAAGEAFAEAARGARRVAECRITKPVDFDNLKRQLQQLAPTALKLSNRA